MNDVSNHNTNLSEDELVGAGCLGCILFSILALAISFIVGALFGWPWGVAFYLGTIGLFGMYLLRKVLKDGEK